MKALFNYIKDRIADRMPEIKTVRVWNNQFMYSRGEKYVITEHNDKFRTEKAFRYPACFIEFETMEVYNRAMGLKDILLTIRFHLGIEGYKLERLDTLDFIDRFTEAMQLMAPTEASGLNFTTFQKLSNQLDYDHDNVQEPIVEYRTLYRSSAGYWYKNAKTVAVVDPIVEAHDTDTIVTEL